eukprot:1160424-Pelagomonas_calceolata.AAC.3
MDINMGMKPHQYGHEVALTWTQTQASLRPVFSEECQQLLLAMSAAAAAAAAFLCKQGGLLSSACLLERQRRFIITGNGFSRHGPQCVLSMGA